MLQNKSILLAVFLGGAALLFLAGGAAHAKKELTKKEKNQKAKDIRYQARSAYKEGNYETAIELYEEAEELSSSPATTYVLARCYEKLEKFKEAYEYYKEYVASGDEKNLDKAKEAMAAIEKMPVLINLTTEPADPDCHVDGKEEFIIRTPTEIKVMPGTHEVLLEKPGYKPFNRKLTIAPGEVVSLEAKLEKLAGEEEKPLAEGSEEGSAEKGEASVKLEKKVRGPVPISIDATLGATVSTSVFLGSFIDVSLFVDYRIKQWSVGLGLDNMFFSDSYLLSAYPAGAYTLNVWKGLSLKFGVGFGAACLYASSVGKDEDGNQVVEEGSAWDLVAHADIKLRYKVGPVIIQVVPVHVNVFVGAGSIEASPLAQFAFLAGVVYDF
ncbi:MAG: PEGA domain-containing protein [Pseudomonadota bacterium]